MYIVERCERAARVVIRDWYHCHHYDHYHYYHDYHYEYNYYYYYIVRPIASIVL